MPNGKTSPWMIIGIIGGWIISIVVAMSVTMTNVKKDVDANIDKAIKIQAYPITNGVILETKVMNINEKLDKIDNKLDKLLEQNQ